MKRILAFLLSAILLFTAIGTASAASTETRVFYEEQSLGDGFAVTSEIVVHETLGQFASVPDFLVRMQAAKFIPHTDMDTFPSIQKKLNRQN